MKLRKIDKPLHFLKLPEAGDQVQLQFRHYQYSCPGLPSTGSEIQLYKITFNLHPGQ